MALDSNVLPNIFVFHEVQKLPLSSPFPLVLDVLPGPVRPAVLLWAGVLLGPM